MYETFYGFNAKPFQLKPDPRFFFGSKGHNRAMAYLEYGISQGEGFIVITGEIGAGKTTLMRNLFCELKSENIVAAQIVNTHVGSDDILRLVAAAFGLEYENATKATLLHRVEQFLKQCDRQGKRALLVVDEAQNLTPRAVEELRMLSNFYTEDKSLLQTFLLGQPEFRRVLLSEDMEQLLQRVIASYHLGPLDIGETQSYIEHRLQTVGWKGNPTISTEAFSAIYSYTGGIPRKINSLCDRMFLMGYIEELQAFDESEVNQVIADIKQEFKLPPEKVEIPVNLTALGLKDSYAYSNAENMDDRMARMERSISSVIDALKKMLPSSKMNNSPD
ncbi:XrtA/PEP-CTERM system-associated ATPase [Solimicrobium silvestre]|uniref:Putative secretion ATPase, PEP-CTERM locus subfamily n=1 Tax=Solimicrobium silvestre TaxID=2099400 RepID=A0A2S9H0M8_9BURK|nr:XrtA/PEP-CTERM system-associated ATPase [Solimicrobium silvestre]PRC93531.1 putative secretion ATPase, PEP-CTERM locus subfamily [Solimicrobium silvestre]